MRVPLTWYSLLLTLISTALSIDLDVYNRQSILNATAILAHGVQELYNGNVSGGVLGKWPYPPYYWWESGGAWGGMMQYWAYTRDDSYTNVMMNGLVAQLGPNYDFVVPAEAFDTGNDDQAFWVFVAMSAAEYGFPAPPAPAPAWLTVVENAWNDYYNRWQTTGVQNCGGGLKCMRLSKSRTTESLTVHRAILSLECWIHLQECYFQWSIFPNFCSTRTLHRQSNLRGLGQQGVDLVFRDWSHLTKLRCLRRH